MDTQKLPSDVEKAFGEWSTEVSTSVRQEDIDTVRLLLSWAFRAGLTSEPAEREAEFVAEIAEYRDKISRLLEPGKHKLVSLIDGTWTFESPIFPIFVETMAQMLDEFPDAKNYLEFTSDHAKYGPLVHVIQRANGKTPGTLKSEAEDKLRRAKQILKRYADGETGGALANAVLKELG
jgi:hypothetical protein